MVAIGHLMASRCCSFFVVFMLFSCCFLVVILLLSCCYLVVVWPFSGRLNASATTLGCILGSGLFSCINRVLLKYLLYNSFLAN